MNISDARIRALRTLGQGVATVAVVAGIAVVDDALTSGRTDYRAVLVAAGTAALTAAVSYLHNKISPAR